METEILVTEGLGDNTFLVASRGIAAVIDPQRDISRVVRAARAHQWDIRYVLETHVHNDYVSGALALHERTGAELVLPAEGAYRFPHRAAFDGAALSIGDLQFVARHSPGHTPEHIVWEVRDSASPRAVLTGGSLLVGSTGRTDLLGDSSAERLARAQFLSIRRLLALPHDVLIYPTHGAGSFCAAGVPNAARTSTLGDEIRDNPVFNLPTEDAFVASQLTSGRWPSYYRHMAPLNRRGTHAMTRPPGLRRLTPGELAGAMAQHIPVVDGRDRVAFAAGHVPGSLNIELNSFFGVNVGWFLPFGRPLALVLPEPIGESAAEAVLQLSRVGFDDVVGVLSPGFDAWVTQRRAVRNYPVANMADLFALVSNAQRPAILDVRDPSESLADGALPGALAVFVADLPAEIHRLRDSGPYWVVCATGQRASIAASLLNAAGIGCRLVARGGTAGWIGRFQALEATEAGLPG